jgi:hypothetical protein
MNKPEPIPYTNARQHHSGRRHAVACNLALLRVSDATLEPGHRTTHNLLPKLRTHPNRCSLSHRMGEGRGEGREAKNTHHSSNHQRAPAPLSANGIGGEGRGDVLLGSFKTSRVAVMHASAVHIVPSVL